MISFKNSLTKNLAMILYPFLGNLTTQIAIFSVFHISNTARSTVIIAMQNSHFNRGVVTLGPIGPPKCCLLKFIYFEEATKFCETSTLLLSYVVPVKNKVEISQNFVAFSEYMNFELLLLTFFDSFNQGPTLTHAMLFMLFWFLSI